MFRMRLSGLPVWALGLVVNHKVEVLAVTGIAKRDDVRLAVPTGRCQASHLVGVKKASHRLWNQIGHRLDRGGMPLKGLPGLPVEGLGPARVAGRKVKDDQFLDPCRPG